MDVMAEGVGVFRAEVYHGKTSARLKLLSDWAPSGLTRAQIEPALLRQGKQICRGTPGVIVLFREQGPLDDAAIPLAMQWKIILPSHPAWQRPSLR